MASSISVVVMIITVTITINQVNDSRGHEAAMVRWTWTS